MTPYIRQNILSNAPKLPLNDDQFEELAEARVVLNAAFALEESYDLLIGNYIEVEKELLLAAASDAVRDLDDYQDSFKLRSTINRRVVNLLTATRLYLDQAPQRLKNCAVDPDSARAEFKLRASEHYDGFFNYRFLEALRNHVQHCGLAVHRVTQGRKSIGEGAGHAIEISVKPFVQKKYLETDGAFKRKILKEMPEEVMLTLSIREYLQCIGNLHTLVRSHFADRVSKSRQLISAQISRYANENDDATIGLTAFRINSRGKQESLPLFLNWDDVREKLVLRNSGLVGLGRHFVTGRAN